MKTLALFLLTVFSTPALADDSCNEGIAAAIRAGNFGQALAVNVRHLTLLEMSVEMSRQVDSIQRGHLFTPVQNTRNTGRYAAYIEMRKYVNAEREKLQPCLEALKEMKR